MSDDTVVNFPTKEPEEFLIGPKPSYYDVVVEGRRIPKLTAQRDGDEVLLVLDGRLGASFPEPVARTVAWLVGNALAIGSGYAWLGAENKDQPFAPRVARIDGPQPNLKG